MKTDSRDQESLETNRSVSLRDIALELDISHATVSMALRGNPRISAKTTERVKQKAEEMGYVADPTLSALSNYRIRSKTNPRTSVLAWIEPPGETEAYEQSIEFQLYRKGAQDTARRLGFELEVFGFENHSLESLENQFRQRNIQGIAVAPITSLHARVQWSRFPWQEFSAIRFGRNEMGPPTHYVASAQVGNTVRAFRKIYAKGYRRIGYIGRPMGRMMYIAGYLGCQMELPEEQKVSPMLLDYKVDTPTLESMERWMAEQRPDAVLTNDGAIPARLDELGFSVPGDVALATMSIHDTPIDAGIDQNPEEIGAQAISSLVAQVNEHHFGIPAVRSSILVDGSWVDGAMLPDRT